MEKLTAQAKQLSETVHELRDTMEKLGLRSVQQERRSDKQHRAQRLTALALALDVVLSMAMATVVWTNHTTSDRLSNSLRHQCSLYSLLIGSYNPNTRAQGTDRQTYEDIFATLRESYRELGCTTPIAPPRTDMPPTPPR